MNSLRRKQYSIHRVRLINFHNIQNETISVNHGGHLFLLGDNGSGKTTVLDAIHYVLTAGELVELNSAARVVGQRAEGRRLQGIIMRFNTETGPLNPHGGITYAVLELRDDKDNYLSVGLGMSCRSMEEQLHRWGFIEPRPLEELPLLIEDGKGLRARDRHELKEALGEHGGYYNIGPFRREVTHRLFNNADVFHDVCRLLRMGKAYREIVAQSNDYHELFMRLMPEPKTEIFERVVDSLQSLEESKSVLEDFERKQRYVRELESFSERIQEAGEQLIRLDWLEQNLAIEERAAALLAEERLLGELHTRLVALDSERLGHSEERERARQVLDDLRTSDREGLVRQEKELTLEHARKREQREELVARLDQLEREHETLSRQVERDRATLRKLIVDTNLHLAKLAPTLPFPITELTGELDALFRAEQPEEQLPALPVGPATERGRTEIIRLERESSLRDQEEKDLGAEIDRRTRAIAKFEAERTVSPNLRHFGEALELLRQHMIGAYPLYEGLEWKPSVPQTTKALVEDLIGNHALATLMVEERHFIDARDLLVRQYPQLRITHSGLGLREIPDWFRKLFDLETSHPDALACLAAQMIAEGDPDFFEVMGQRVVAFRGHQRRLAAPPARLIGTESRKKALSREVKEQQKLLKEIEIRRREVSRQAQDLREVLEILTRFVAYLGEAQSAYLTQVPALHKLNLRHLHLTQGLDEMRTRRGRLDTELAHLLERRDTARKLISEEGLVNLEQKVESATAKVAEIEAVLAQLDQRKGGLVGEVETARARMAAMEHEQRTALTQLEQIGTRLLAHHPGIGDVEKYILEDQQGYRFRAAAEIGQARKKAAELLIETRTLLRSKLGDPSLGATFAFTYDEDKNELLDRRGRTITEIVANQSKTIEDQRQVVNEETFMLFKEIIMKELIGELRKMVFDLEEMNRNINDLLKRRAFGNHRYRFSLRPRQQYKHLVAIIHNLDQFDSEPEKELRNFFEDHKEEIVNTEAGEIPDLLDYRNWYKFEMQVMRVREDGEVSDRVAMTRSIKGLGSGGEQAVPNYLLVLTIAHFLYKAGKTRMFPLLFDEAFYGIDASRRDQLLGFASDLGLQLFVASPDQDGVKREIDFSTTLLIIKDIHYNVHTYKFDWRNPDVPEQTKLFESNARKPVGFE